MPAELLDLVTFVAGKALRHWSAPSTLISLGGIVTAFALTVLVHRWRVRQFADAWSNQLGTDATHMFFYMSGLFSVIIGAPAYALTNAAISRFAPFLQLNLGRELHPIAHFVVLTLSLDFVAYWAHRACHRVPWLWELHKVHHSQTMLTPFTNFRFHAGDVLLRTLLMLIPMAVLGTQTEVFLAVIFFEVALNGMAHSDLPWTYGPLGRLFVNPQFHRLHHSTDPRHFDHNFAQQYTFWDSLFGTAYANEHEVPPAYGLPGETMPRSFVRQQVVPALTLLQRVLRSARPQRLLRAIPLRRFTAAPRPTDA